MAVCIVQDRQRAPSSFASEHKSSKSHHKKPKISMARYKNLGDWEIVQEKEEISSPTRRTRRGTATPESHLALTRPSDHAIITVGDVVFIESDISSALDIETPAASGFTGVITKLVMGLSCRVELWVLPMVDASMVKSVKALEEVVADPQGDHSTAQPLSSATEKTVSNEGMVQEAKSSETDISTAKVESPNRQGDSSNGANAIPPGDSSNMETDTAADSQELVLISKSIRVEIGKISQKVQIHELSCNLAADSSLERVAPLDFPGWIEQLKMDCASAIFSITEKTSIIVSPRKRAVSETPVKRNVPKKKISYVMSSGSESEPETSESEPESEPEVATPKKARKARESPRKKNDSPRKNRDSARHTDVFRQVVNVLSPVNKGFKVKSGSTRSSLPSLSRDPLPITSEKKEAFRELKDKLHLSTRISHLPCREDQFDELYMNLESAIMEKMGTCFYISGTPGVGKTATIREVVAALQDNVHEGYVDDFDFLEINSLKLLSPNSAYEKLWDYLTGIKVTPSNASLLLEEYFSRGQDIQKPLVILMDELDQLVTKNQKVIYNFFNWPTYLQSKLIVLAVANTMDLPERVFSNKIASRLGLRRMAFRGYTEEELGIIIENRLKMLSEQNKRIVEITPDAMRFASKKVAIVSGDARRALTICRRAVEIAENEYLETETPEQIPEDKQSYSVRIEHIGLAITETVNSPTARFLQTLPFASKLLLVGILLRIRRAGSGENSLGDIMDEMRNTIQLETKVMPSLSSKTSVEAMLYGGHVRIHHLNYIVNEMVDQGILRQENVRSERHRKVALNISEDEVLAVLKKDDDVGHML